MNHKNKLILSLVVLVSLLALPALAENLPWTAPHSTAPNCDPTVDIGCNPPINVGSTDQSKASGRITLGALTLPRQLSGSRLHSILGAISDPTKVARLLITGSVSGKDSLNIIGSSLTTAKDRLVQIWDNLIVNGNLNVTGTTTTKILCVGNGTCVSTLNNNGTSQWTTSGNNIYNNNAGNVGNVGIGVKTPGLAKAVVEVGSVDSSSLYNLLLDNPIGANEATLAFGKSSGNSAHTQAIIASNPINTTDFNSGGYLSLKIRRQGSGTFREIMKINQEGVTISPSHWGTGTYPTSLTVKDGGLVVSGYGVGSKIQAEGDICTSLAGGKCLSSVSWGAGLWASTTANNGIYYTSGRVGIGTNAPNAMLHVAGGSMANRFSLNYLYNGAEDKDFLNVLDLGSGVTGRESNAGKIGYQKLGSYNALDIVGAGTAIKDRLVNIWDNLFVHGNLDVEGTTTTNNLVVNNKIYSNFICTLTGTCIDITKINTGGGGSDKWASTTAPAPTGIYYNLGNVGIGTIDPKAKLSVAGYGAFADGIGMSGDSLVYGTTTIEFGKGVQKINDAGKIGYDYVAKNELDIFGSGIRRGGRLVKIWDNLTVPGTINTTNICTTDGVNCSSVTNIINNSNNGVKEIIASNGIEVSNLTAGKVQIAAKVADPIWNADKLQSKIISNTPPTAGQFLKFDGTTNKWTPGTVDIPTGQWTVSGNNIYYAKGGGVLGNVGINTVNPSYPLHVNGSAYIVDSLKVNSSIMAESICTADGTCLTPSVDLWQLVSVGGGLPGAQSTVGYVGIGMEPQLGDALAVSGRVVFNSPKTQTVGRAISLYKSNYTIIYPFNSYYANLQSCNSGDDWGKTSNDGGVYTGSLAAGGKCKDRISFSILWEIFDIYTIVNTYNPDGGRKSLVIEKDGTIDMTDALMVKLPLNYQNPNGTGSCTDSIQGAMYYDSSTGDVCVCKNKIWGMGKNEWGWRVPGRDDKCN